ncbi:hypothetical protein F2P81_014079 [Scophthalmus maximus]|uniref:Uncharacterized protein n=1 Tax=Scophthalmus maximus TaxID=52904 RepID=A0A6A4SIS5_SCOMX|nr:hypothetical protein F2P81_014079 [Scophthalmus maximus]
MQSGINKVIHKAGTVIGRNLESFESVATSTQRTLLHLGLIDMAVNAGSCSPELAGLSDSPSNASNDGDDHDDVCPPSCHSSIRPSARLCRCRQHPIPPHPIPILVTISCDSRRRHEQVFQTSRQEWQRGIVSHWVTRRGSLRHFIKISTRFLAPNWLC